MKKLLLVILLLVSVAVRAQQDSTFSKKDIKSTQFEYLFSYYHQDGEHSAVTGGVGTEKLDVFMNKMNITHEMDSSNTLYFEAGIDVISSASTDKIDMAVSSASAVDNRLWASVGYQYQKPDKSFQIGGKPSFSMESDYLSWGMNAWWAQRNTDNNWRYGINTQFYADDLRWGRLNEDYRAPVTVVYPIELRDSVWFDVYRRFSYNFTFDIQHDINKRMSIGFFPGLIIQNGLLSTPYHRFYFVGDATAVVENLPRERFKIPLGIQLNAFVGARTVLRLYYRYYWDDFGISAHTLSLETPVKITPQWIVTPFMRFYTQDQSDYFYTYQSAPAGLSYFTSDYDLSGFTSFKYGAGIKYMSVKGGLYKQFGLRYAHYTRSDGLYFNQLTSYLSVPGKRKPSDSYMANK